ncbi:hypothetical protein LCGC14_2417930 [marine sediment metagenome]|uniref:Right handed beta helix domain-containing protein n=1 Tax=marine sediment metagenome TaxID=412755 RepID=A0A0F9CCP4_9ZZZZ
MGNAKRYIRSLALGHLIYPESLASGGGLPLESGRVHYVDGDLTPTGTGRTWGAAFNTIAGAISEASAGDVLRIATLTMSSGAADPSSYEENLTIPAAKGSLSLIGTYRGKTQGGLPQLKDGATTTQEIIRVRAPGCVISDLGFNGAGNTGGGVLLDESGSGNTAFGTTIQGCHFKNCNGSTSTDVKTGGAIMWSAVGGAWQARIADNVFYKNTGDVVLKGTTSSRPQDVVIEDNTFSGPAGSVDANLYLAGGSGMNGVTIKRNDFPAVDLPALGSGTVLLYIDAASCTGLLAGNTFATIVDTLGSEKTFGATGSGGIIPTTMRMANNWGEATANTYTGQIHRT